MGYNFREIMHRDDAVLLDPLGRGLFGFLLRAALDPLPLLLLAFWGLPFEGLCGYP
jgi:hypothetical protein